MSLSPSAPFDTIAASYDEKFSLSFVGQAQRSIVWDEMGRVFVPGQRILEINCGTAIDAAHLARGGIEVYAYDASPAMVGVARRRVFEESLQERIRLGILRNEDLARVEGESLFDGLLSDFGGLNCVEDLGALACQAARLLRPNAPALVCVFGHFCMWEILWGLRQLSLKKSFRRLRGVVHSDIGADAAVAVYNHSIQTIRRAFAPHFILERWHGIGVAVPPSYLEGLTRRYPGVFTAAARVDRRLSGFPFWRSLADHALLVFRRRKA